MSNTRKSPVEILTQEVSLERLAEARGVKLRNKGTVLTGACPFHEGALPALTLDPKTNTWTCDGDCQGGVIEWTMKAEGVSRHHAIELLRSDFEPRAATPTKAKRSTTAKLSNITNPDEADDVVMRRVVDYYHHTLKESPEAMAYLQERGLHSSEMVETFQIGYANRTLAYRLPAKNRKAGATIRTQLQRLGILRKSGHEHLRGSVVIPIIDDQGRVVQLYGRKTRNDLRKGTATHLYLPGPRIGVWNREAIAASKDLILCPSLIDALSFWCSGHRSVTTTFGLEKLSGDLEATLEEHGTKRVWLAFRRDKSGDRHAKDIGAQLSGMGIETFLVRFPRDMDANDVLRTAEDSAKVLDEHLRKAEWLGKGTKPTTRTEESHDREAESPPLPVASQPPPEPKTSDTSHEEHQLTLTLGDRRWRVRGLERNTSYTSLRVNILVSREGDSAFHVDTLELYSSRHRAAFIKQASEELQTEPRILKRDLGQLLLKLEALQDEQIRKALQPEDKTVHLDEDERRQAMALLKDPNLLDRVLADLNRIGFVGEEDNKLTAYLAATSRKLREPLAVVIQSSSAAGKSSLMDAVLSLIPEEERASYSAMTGQSLYYLGQRELSHKVLAIAEEEGASSASYALKLLQSEGSLTIASTGKDPTTGRLITQSYRVEGPVMLFLTTTAIDIDEELLNRCLVLSVDEGREQTKAIHEAQRERQSLSGLQAKTEREQSIRLHQNAQRLLRPLHVVNPFADRLRFADHAPRTRRDHSKYLVLIQTVALLHQYQRPIQELEHKGTRIKYIEVTESDIQIANRVAHQVLGRSLDDLPPQTRNLLHQLHGMVCDIATRHAIEAGDVRFSRRQARELLGIGDTQLRVHLARLAELEYVIVHRGGQGQRYAYELAYDGKGEHGDRFLVGLADASTTTTSRGQTDHLAGQMRGECGQDAGGVRGSETEAKRSEPDSNLDTGEDSSSKRTPRDHEDAGAYAKGNA